MIALGIIIVVFIAQTYLASLVQPDWASWDEQHANNAFFYGVQLVGGDIFMKIMLVINIIAVGIANIMNAQLRRLAPAVFHGSRQGDPEHLRQGLEEVEDAVGRRHLHRRRRADPGPDAGHELADHARQLWRAVVVLILNFAVFKFFFIKEKRRKTVGDWVKYLICPWIGILILAYVFTGFDPLTYIVAA